MGNHASSNTLYSANVTYSALVAPMTAPCKPVTSMKTTTTVRVAFSHSVSVVVASIKSSCARLVEDIVTSFSGSSLVLTELEETWYTDKMMEIERRCAQLQADAYETSLMIYDCQFLCPCDTVVATIGEIPMTHKRYVEDDCVSCTTDATDALSDDEVAAYASDSDDFHDDESDGEEEDEEDLDVEKQADRLLCLSPSCCSSFSAASTPIVYVEDYLCPCGECPQYQRIVTDVETTMPYLSRHAQTSVIRVVQAFSTYHEVIGYLPEMLATAEECLQVWGGDENHALQSLVMLYDEVPQLICQQLIV